MTDLRPGFVDTEMAKGAGEFWVASAEKAARQMLAAIEGKQAVAYISRRWWSIGALLKLVPRQLYQRL